jgi:membrane protein required for colicin V production
VSLLDLIVLVFVAASVVGGFVAGFARSGIGFLATVFGVVCGFWFYGIPAVAVRKYVHSVTASNLIGFFVVFFGLIFVGALIGKLLSKLFKWTGLSWLDRLMGAMFGLVRGALVAVAFIAVLLAFTPKPTPNWMVNSAVLPYAIDASNTLAALAPNTIKDAFRESVREIRKIWDEQLRVAREKLKSKRPEPESDSNAEPKKPEPKKEEPKKKEKSH